MKPYPASLSSLPEELIEKICQALLDLLLLDDTLSDLSNLCRTSKLLDRIVRPFMYRDVKLPGLYKLFSYTKCIAKRPELAKIVRSLSIEYERDDYLADLDSSLPEMLAAEKLVSNSASYTSSRWVSIVEGLLSRTTELKDLTIKVDGESECCYLLSENSSETSKDYHGVLPCLQNLVIHDANEVNDVLAIARSLCQGQPVSITCIDCGIPAFEAEVAMERASWAGLPTPPLSIKGIKCYNSCPVVSPVYLPLLLKCCPRLEEFHFAISDEDKSEIDDDEEDEEADPFTAQDLILLLQHSKATLKILSLTTESWGDADGFPSLREFKALEHLRVDIFELADYEEDDDDDDEELDQSSDSDSDSEPTHDDEQETPGAWDSDWEDLDSSSDSDDSSDTNSKCKPILHLLPKSLKTLWLDNLYALDGDLDEELIKLAQTAKTDFINFKQITVEGAEELKSCDTLQEAFEAAGIKFVKKPLHHFWSVDEGLIDQKIIDDRVTREQEMIDKLRESAKLLTV